MTIPLIATLVIAVVFLSSGVAKLRHPDDLDGWRDLGVPAALRRPWLLRAHPWGEICLAAALVLLGGALGAAAALLCVALMVAYLWLVVRAVRYHPDAACACFGARRPIGWATVIRNAWLLLVSLVALGGIWATPLLGGTALAAIGGAPVSPVEAVLGAGLAALTALLVARPEPAEARVAGASNAASGPFGSIGAAGAAAGTGSGPAVGAAIPGEATAAEAGDEDADAGAPPVAAPRLRVPAVTVLQADGTSANLRDLALRSPILLLAVSERCASCLPVIERTAAWRALLPELQVRLLLAPTPGESALTERAEPQSLHDPHQHVRASIAEWPSPTAVLLGADGLLVGEPVTGYAGIAEFVADIAESLHGVRPADEELHGGRAG